MEWGLSSIWRFLQKGKHCRWAALNFKRKKTRKIYDIKITEQMQLLLEILSFFKKKTKRLYISSTKRDTLNFNTKMHQGIKKL